MLDEDVFRKSFHATDAGTKFILPKYQLPSFDYEAMRQKSKAIPQVISRVESIQDEKKPSSESMVYVASLSAANRSQGTLSEPSWFFNPRIFNLQCIKVLGISIPWLTGVAADPNPFYILTSKNIGSLRAHGYLNGTRANILGYVINHGIIGRRLTYIDTGSSHTLEMLTIAGSYEKTLSSIDISIYDPTGALVVLAADWSITVLMKSSPLK